MEKKNWLLNTKGPHIFHFNILNFCINVCSGFVRVRLNEAKSVFMKKVEKRQAKSVFLFNNLRMSVVVSSNA